MDTPAHSTVHGPNSEPYADNAPAGIVTAVVRAPEADVHAISGGRLHLAGGRATPPQRHSSTESILAVLSGNVAVLTGPQLTPLFPKPGEMVYIPATVEYALVNLSLNASVLALVFRSDPGFSTDVEMLPELDQTAHLWATQLRDEHLQRLMRTRTSRVRRAR